MSQRDVILPVTKIFTVASGVTKSVSLEDTAGASVNVTYATLIDLSGGVAVNVGPTPDVDQASTSSLGSTAWMRLAPGNFSGTNWQYKAYTSGVGYSQGSGTLFSSVALKLGAGPIFASSIDSAKSAPGVVGPMGTSLVLTTMVPFNVVTVGNHSEELRIFALTYGVVKQSNSIKDQERAWAP